MDDAFSAPTVAFILLFGLFGLIIYLLATNDDPFIPSRLIPKKEKAKSGIINWYAWKGPMFVEGFNDFGNVTGGTGTNGSQYQQFTSPPSTAAQCGGSESHQEGVLYQAPESLSLTQALEGFGSCPGLPPDSETCESPQQRNKRKCDFLKDERSCHGKTYSACKGIKLSTSEDAYRNEFHPCSFKMRGPNPLTGDLGNYKQCTNNSLDAPNHLKFKSQGRWDYDITPHEDRISPVCYKRNYDNCLTAKGHKD